MAREDTPDASSALRAINTCPRKPTPRPVKEPSFEVANHVRAYLDHQRYEQAYTFLHSLLSAGTSISTPAKPYVGLLAPPVQLALASTLVVYPPVTTKATSADVLKGSDAALRYLRCMHNIVKGPAYKDVKTAFTFSDTRWRGPSTRSPLSSPSRTYDFEQLRSVAANADSLWSSAEDFWHVVGWALNCSVMHKKRWARWKLWLDIMLKFLQTDWDYCIEVGGSDTAERQATLQTSLIWKYICSQEPLAGNTRKRMFRAIFASADAQSMKEFTEVWPKETAEPKAKDTTERHGGLVDFEAGEMGDYESPDEDAPIANGRSSRNAPASSLEPLENGFIPDYDAAVERLGGLDAVDLRQRLVALLAEVAKELPSSFTSVEYLFDTLGTQLQYLPAPVLNVLITTSRLSSDHQIALNVTILTALTSQKYINYTTTTPTQQELETLLLPMRARANSFAANAKVSLLLEQVFMVMIEKQYLVELTLALRKVVDGGIAKRKNANSKKDTPEEKQGEMLLKASSERLRGLLSCWQFVCDEALGNVTNKLPVRESPRKKRPRTYT